MDLSHPPREYLLELDENIARLEEETRIMKEKLGFEGVSEAETIVALRKKQKAAKMVKKYDEEGRQGLIRIAV